MPVNHPTRRQWLAWMLATTTAAACDTAPTPQAPPAATPPPTPAPPQTAHTEPSTPPKPSKPAPSVQTEPARTPPKPAKPHTWHRLDFPSRRGRPRKQRAMILDGGGPVLIALHGLGETRTLDAGARGWKDDYLLDEAYSRLLNPPLKATDFRNLVAADRLTAINAALKTNPFPGLTVACPFTPNLMHGWSGEAKAYGRFLLQELMPEIARTTGRDTQKDIQDRRVAIDGVSLGGRVAMLVGLTHPEVFGVVGAMQPAFRHNELGRVVELAKEASKQHPQTIRLMTSTRDHFKPIVTALSQRFHKAGIKHDLLITPGPHDYVWNQGPGAIEMLHFHSRLGRP